MFCVFNRSKINNYDVVIIISLCSDPFDSVTLDVAPEWVGSKFELLNNNGTWNTIKVETLGLTIKVNTQVTLMNPLIIKFNKVQEILKSKINFVIKVFRLQVNRLQELRDPTKLRAVELADEANLTKKYRIRKVLGELIRSLRKF